MPGISPVPTPSISETFPSGTSEMKSPDCLDLLSMLITRDRERLEEITALLRLLFNQRNGKLTSQNMRNETITPVHERSSWSIEASHEASLDNSDGSLPSYWCIFGSVG